MTGHNHVEQFCFMRLFIPTLLAISLASSCTAEGKPGATPSDAKVQNTLPKTTVLKEITEFNLPDEFSSFDTVPQKVPSEQPDASQSLKKVKPMTKAPPYSTPLRIVEDITKDACAQLSKDSSYGSAEANTNEVVGHSADGAPLVVEHYGSHSGPQILVVGQVHGNECSPALFVKAVRTLAPTNWGIYLIPTINPDGLKTLDRRASGVDLNRDGLELSAPEARALMDFTSSRELFLTIHLHSPNGWVGYYGTDRAVPLANALSNSMALGYLRSAGSGRGFLWEGQAKRMPGHQSVLVELPAVFTQEAPSAPERVQLGFREVSIMVERMTKALFEYMNQEASGKDGAFALR